MIPKTMPQLLDYLLRNLEPSNPKNICLRNNFNMDGNSYNILKFY